MSIITTSGALLKRFYADPKFWPATRYQDDTLIYVNGVNVQDLGLDPSDAADDAVVTLEYGEVLDADDPSFRSQSLLAYFNAWRATQPDSNPPSADKLPKTFDPAGWQWQAANGQVVPLESLSREDLLQVACNCMAALEAAEEAGLAQQAIFTAWRLGNKVTPPATPTQPE